MPLTIVSAPAVEPLTIAEARRQLVLPASAGEPAPTVPTIALANPSAPGNCDNGAWRIGFTFVTADGETEIGPLSAVVTVVDKTSNGQIAVTAIALGGSAVTARKAYAVPPGGTTAKFAATINNNTATTATINIAAASLGADAPTVNTTEDPELTGWIATARENAETATNRALITQTWDLVLDGFPREDYIEMPRPPLVSVTSVKCVDTSGVLQTLTENTDYLVQAPAGPRCARGRIALPFAGVWPVTLRQMGAVTIRFVCGYGASGSFVPAMLKTAMKCDLGTLYENREGVLIGTSGSKLPMVDGIYWRYRSPQTQKLGI